MKMYEILDFKGIYKVIKDKKLPVKTAYKMNKFLTSVDEELRFYQIQLDKIIEKYAQTDEEGNVIYTADKQSVKIIEGQEAECQQEMNDLMNLDIDLTAHMFTLEELADFDFTMDEVRVFMPFIKE